MMRALPVSFKCWMEVLVCNRFAKECTERLPIDNRKCVMDGFRAMALLKMSENTDEMVEGASSPTLCNCERLASTLDKILQYSK